MKTLLVPVAMHDALPSVFERRGSPPTASAA